MLSHFFSSFSADGCIKNAAHDDVKEFNFPANAKRESVPMNIDKGDRKPGGSEQRPGHVIPVSSSSDSDTDCGNNEKRHGGKDKGVKDSNEAKSTENSTASKGSISDAVKNDSAENGVAGGRASASNTTKNSDDIEGSVNAHYDEEEKRLCSVSLASEADVYTKFLASSSEAKRQGPISSAALPSISSSTSSSVLLGSTSPTGAQLSLPEPSELCQWSSKCLNGMPLEDLDLSDSCRTAWELCFEKFPRQSKRVILKSNPKMNRLRKKMAMTASMNVSDRDLPTNNAVNCSPEPDGQVDQSVAEALATSNASRDEIKTDPATAAVTASVEKNNHIKNHGFTYSSTPESGTRRCLARDADHSHAIDDAGGTGTQGGHRDNVEALLIFGVARVIDRVNEKKIGNNRRCGHFKYKYSPIQCSSSPSSLSSPTSTIQLKRQKATVMKFLLNLHEGAYGSRLPRLSQELVDSHRRRIVAAVTPSSLRPYFQLMSRVGRRASGWRPVKADKGLDAEAEAVKLLETRGNSTPTAKTRQEGMTTVKTVSSREATGARKTMKREKDLCSRHDIEGERKAGDKKKRKADASLE